MSAAIGLLAGLVVWLLWPASPLSRLAPRRAVGDDRPTRRPGYPLRWRVAAALALGAAVWLLLPEHLLLAPLAAAGAFVGVGRLRPPAVRDAAHDELGEALDFLAVCLEAGAPVQQAVATVADVSRPATQALLRRVLAHLEVGRAPEEAWAGLHDHPAWRLPSKDLVRSVRSGTSLVEALRLHAADARAEARDAAVKRARTVGVKSVLPLMVCFLPAFVLVGVVPIIASLIGGLLG